MSDQLRIAAALRKLDNASLEKLITLRMVNTSHLRDFFDLADTLSSTKSVEAAIASLSANQLRDIELLAEGTKPDANKSLVALMLAEKTDKGFAAFDCVIEAQKQFASKHARVRLTTGAISIVGAEPTMSIADIDRDASLAIFDIIQAITELIFELEQRYIREVAKRSVGLPDVKRLANHLSKPNEYVKQVFELAQLADLAVVENGRWQLSMNSEKWIASTDARRWQSLASSWLNLLGDDSAAELLQISAGGDFAGALVELFPFADSAVGARISKVADLAETIGLVAGGRATSWLPVLAGVNTEKASKLAVAGLPVADERIIVQADLTLIAPSPLPTELEIHLRRFADTEKIGMASSYRLSAISISHGLETGMSVSEIRDLLEKLSGKPLPQPVEYLLREAETRFGRLKVKQTKNGSHAQIESSDPILLAEIHNDHRLKPFALHFDEQGNLHTRFEAELVYFALREANFVAVQVDENGEVISPQKPTSRSAASESKKNLIADIERMRENDKRGASNPDDDDLLRQIQLAIKNKAKILITLTTAAGDEVQYLVEPVGVANGRLRAKDRKADIERTLPLSSVISIAIQ